MLARVVNLLLGVWLFASAFAWPHGRSQSVNAAIVGVLIIAAAGAGLAGRAWGRVASSLLGGWLVVSAFLLGTIRTATFWNHLLVGFAVVMIAMMGRGLPFDPRRTRADQPTQAGF